MRIAAVELYEASLRMHEPFVIATMTVDIARSLFVKIIADDGIFGLGEAQPYWRIVGETPATVRETARDFARLLLGKDPLDIEARLGDLANSLAGNRTSRSAFDMALHDLAGKVAGLPLYALLGGGKRPFTTDRTVGLASPEKMAADAARFRARGFPAIKIKIGADPTTDVARVRAVRAAIGAGTALRLDANQGYDEAAAIRVLRAVGSADVEYCEQPVPAWNVAGMARVRAAVPIPINADEAVFDKHDCFRVAAAGAADYVNLKLSKTGGVREATAAAAVAEAAGLGLAMGCMTETRLGLTAAAHVVCARRAFRFVDLDGADFLAEDPIVGGMTIDDAGGVSVPDAPGLGLDLDPAALARWPKIVVAS
jgi:L-alanine-DL-glutamate epimerase-like enolase superfamily enzyme